MNAAMDEQHNLAGLGSVIRNHRGEIVVAAVNTVKSYGDVDMNEAKVVMWECKQLSRQGHFQ